MVSQKKLGVGIIIQNQDDNFLLHLRDEDTNNMPTYTVKLVDPRQILENTQLIISDYAGSVLGNFNLFNILYLLKSSARIFLRKLKFPISNGIIRLILAHEKQIQMS